jgi:uncharacterized protein (TIGR03085 family)
MSVFLFFIGYTRYMTKKEFVKNERKFMVDFLTRLSPAQWRAASLCKGWSVEDVAAHTVVRQGLVAPAGIVIPSLHALHDNAIKKLEARGHKVILQKLQKYPWYMPAVINTGEYYVHNEDMLRGALNKSRSEPSADEAEILWGALKGLVKVNKKALADLGSVQFENTKTSEVVTVENTHNPIDTVVAGAPGELLLFVFGRRKAAKVKITKTAL